MTLETLPVACPEMLVISYHPTMRKIPKERTFQVFRCYTLFKETIMISFKVKSNVSKIGVS